MGQLNDLFDLDKRCYSGGGKYPELWWDASAMILVERLAPATAKLPEGALATQLPDKQTLWKNELSILILYAQYFDLQTSDVLLKRHIFIVFHLSCTSLYSNRWTATASMQVIAEDRGGEDPDECLLKWLEPVYERTNYSWDFWAKTNYRQFEEFEMWNRLCRWSLELKDHKLASLSKCLQNWFDPYEARLVWETKGDSLYVLRNISKRLYVRADEFALSPEDIDGIHIKKLTFGHLIYSKITWIDDASTLIVHQKRDIIVHLENGRG